MESHAPVAALAVMFGRSVEFVRDRVKAGEFGPRCVVLGGEVRVPASGVAFFADSHQAPTVEEFRARNEAELRRKLRGRQLLAA